MYKLLRFGTAGMLLVVLGLGSLVAQEVMYTPGPSVPFVLQGSNGGFAFGDVNGDGTLDVFIPPNNITLNFITSFASAVSTKTVNVGGNVNSVGGLLADFNGDGNLDLWSTNASNPSGGLMYDSAGVFIAAAGTGDLSTAGGTPNVFVGMAVADIDHSNYLSAVWANSTAGGIGDAVPYPRGLGITLLKGGPAGFTKIGKGALPGNLGIDTTFGFEAWQVHFMDATNDGYPDLLMTSFRHGFASTDIMVDSLGARKGCVLFKNDGTGKFVVPTSASLGRTIYNIDSIKAGVCFGRAIGDTGVIVDDTVRHFAAIGSTWGDLNNDGNFDLFLIGLNATDNWNGNGTLVQNVVLYGKGDGTFTYKWNGSNNVNSGLPQAGIRAWDVGDYNNDGIPDLFGSQNFASAVMYRGNGNGTFTDVSSAVYMAGPGGRAGGLVDYNNDGFQDTYTYTGGNSFLQKNGGNSNHWIAFTPVGTGNNKSAIGARFTVYTENGTVKQTRVIKAEANASGGQRSRANFGIGINTSIDSVSVQWPDGTAKTYTGLAIDRYWTVKEGANIPNVPSLTSPVNNAVAIATEGDVQWGAATGALQYRVQVSIDPTFADTKLMAVNATTGSTSYTYSLGGATKYYWRVAGINNGFTSDYTAANNFTTSGSAATVVPTKLSPIGNAANQAAALTMKVARTSDASRYNWQVSSLPTFSPFVSAVTADTTFTLQLTGGTTYYWRVRGVNDLGSSSFSAIDTFAIRAIPSTPGLSSPANGVLNVIVDSVLCRWNSAARADSYVLEVSRSSGSGPVVTEYTVIVPDTTYLLRNLLRNTTYFWRVRANNTGGVSVYSGSNNFTTIPALAPVPSLALPASAAGGVNRLAKFIWAASANANKYRIQVALDNVFASIVRDSVTLDTAMVFSVALDVNTDYYWRVNAQNFGGASAYSTARLFTTGTALGVEEIEGETPREFSLLQNYPNPFNPSTTIQYNIPTSAHVTIKIYDMLGRLVSTLVDEMQSASSYRVTWNASSLSSGMYVYRLQASGTDGKSNYTSFKKLLLMK